MRAGTGGGLILLGLFACTVFLNAFLLFSVQPLIARMILPTFGGAGQVWIVCMLFFQLALLGGYAYADHLIRNRYARVLGFCHLAAVALMGLLLPFDAAAFRSDAWGLEPSLAVFLLLSLTVGGPFLVLSAGSSLLQAWYHATGPSSGASPYALYAASNAGSLLALLGYPLLFEARWSLHDQSLIWSRGYALLLLLLLLCWAVLRKRQGGMLAGEKVPLDRSELQGRERWRRRGIWMLLAALPSSLLLGTTLQVTEDLGAVPLFWVLPFALYLLTYVLAYLPGAGEREGRWRGKLEGLEALGCLVVLALPLLFAERALWMLFLHVGTFFVVALRCHMSLSRLRPEPETLTTYYLFLAAGGALGGLFNGIVAPWLFDGLAEYPIVLVLALAARKLHDPERGEKAEGKKGSGRSKKRRRSPATGKPAPSSHPTVWFVPFGILASTLALWGYHLGTGILRPALIVSFAVAWIYRKRSYHLVGIVALWAFAIYYSFGSPAILHRCRSFFGAHTLVARAGARRYDLIHGNTVHGSQWAEGEARRVPLTYYHPTGPFGEIMQSPPSARPDLKVGVVGLGNGSMAAYGRSGQSYNFFEIDPLVVEMARSPRWFDFLARSEAAIRVVVGDGRISLGKEEKASYDVLVLDAFSSDSVPVHLLTREAFELYLSCLRREGILLVNVSNRHLDFSPLLAGAAMDLGCSMRAAAEDWIDPKEEAFGKLPSTWVIWARQESVLRDWIRDSKRWEKPRPRAGVLAWTDDHVDLLSLIDPFSSSRSNLVLRALPAGEGKEK